MKRKWKPEEKKFNLSENNKQNQKQILKFYEVEKI